MLGKRRKLVVDSLKVDLSLQAKLIGQHYASNEIVEENWFRLGLWFDAEEELVSSVSEHDIPIAEKKTSRSQNPGARQKTKVDTPRPADQRTRTSHKSPTQVNLADAITWAQKSFHHFVNV